MFRIYFKKYSHTKKVFTVYLKSKFNRVFYVEALNPGTVESMARRKH